VRKGKKGNVFPTFKLGGGRAFPGNCKVHTEATRKKTGTKAAGENRSPVVCSVHSLTIIKKGRKKRGGDTRGQGKRFGRVGPQNIRGGITKRLFFLKLQGPKEKGPESREKRVGRMVDCTEYRCTRRV